MLTINLVVRREMGLLKRVRLSPLPTWAMMAAVSVNALIISVVQVVLVLLIGRFGYNVPFPHNLPALIVVLIVGAASFTALGLGVSTLDPEPGSRGACHEHRLFRPALLVRTVVPLGRELGAGEVLVLFARPAHDRRRLRRVDRSERGVELAVARPTSSWRFGASERFSWLRGAGAGLRARPGVAAHGAFQVSP